MTRHVITSSPEETTALGRALAQELAPPALVLLYGELGAGKTTLVKGMVAGLGLAAENEVTSPSFVLVNSYGSPPRLHHVDLYRIEGRADLESLGLDDLLAERALVVIEWAERLPWAEPVAAARVHLEIVSDQQRRIRVDGLKA